jgi:hypothetical protein
VLLNELPTHVSLPLPTTGVLVLPTITSGALAASPLARTSSGRAGGWHVAQSTTLCLLNHQSPVQCRVVATVQDQG